LKIATTEMTNGFCGKIKFLNHNKYFNALIMHNCDYCAALQNFRQ